MNEALDLILDCDKDQNVKPVEVAEEDVVLNMIWGYRTETS